MASLSHKASIEAPLVSVVIPAFRATATLGEAVESCLAQSMGSLEVLVVEDGSGDGTLELAHACANADQERVRVFGHPGGVNAGVAATRNVGIANARGRYIAFLDSDDAWLPHKLRVQLEAFEREDDVGFVFGDVFNALRPDPARPMANQPLEVDPFRASMSELFTGEPFAAAKVMLLHEDAHRIVPSPTPLVRAGLFSGGLRFFGKPQLSLQYEDYLMWKILATRTRFHFVPEPLAIYRVHDVSFTGQFLAKGSMGPHLKGLDEVHTLMLDASSAVLPPDLLDAVERRQAERIVRGAHQVRWQDVPGVMRMASRYGVANEVLRRRLRMSAVELRTRVSRARRRLLEGSNQ